ncbi:MAG: DNA primase, partial [Curvibacter sp.]
LSSAEHVLLCALPAPHGGLLSWLEAQLHEHGPQPWAVLREALREHPDLALAEQLMHRSDLVATEDHGEALAELRNLLKRMLIEQLKAEETEAIAAARLDPAALARYRELQARRLALENGAAAAS